MRFSKLIAPIVGVALMFGASPSRADGNWGPIIVGATVGILVGSVLAGAAHGHKKNKAVVHGGHGHGKHGYRHRGGHREHARGHRHGHHKKARAYGHRHRDGYRGGRGRGGRVVERTVTRERYGRGGHIVVKRKSVYRHKVDRRHSGGAIIVREPGRGDRYRWRDAQRRGRAGGEMIVERRRDDRRERRRDRGRRGTED